ncbi:DUF7673 family protein [Marinobacter sp. CA1]|uniref:DUF7673 family protein n=1 Tax=Marinobacter sp. CA1 TaxID=2817656 RepID=UPI001D06C470|nr:hypothetical protein [Marinobacter sp. CA1]UDL04014.1 hypothetical protein J2887_15000 [Marinobacter sp. CA1]
MTTPIQNNPPAAAQALLSIAAGDTSGSRAAAGVLLSLWDESYGAGLIDAMRTLDDRLTRAALGLMLHTAAGGRLYELLTDAQMAPVIDAWGDYWELERAERERES